MKLKPALTACAIALLAVAPATPALAQQAAGVTLGQLGYHLIDLAPDDGIAPGLVWGSSAGLAYASVYDQDGNEIATVSTDRPGSVGFDNGYASAQATVIGNTASMLLTLHSGYGFASANRSFNFTLSPHTQVVFNVDADLWATPEAPGLSWPTALAELYGSLRGMDSGDWAFATRAQLEDGSQHGILSVSAISQDDWVDGYLAFNAYAVAESHALPVPEPETSAMLLGGLMLLAVAGRLRHWRHD